MRRGKRKGWEGQGEGTRLRQRKKRERGREREVRGGELSDRNGGEWDGGIKKEEKYESDDSSYLQGLQKRFKVCSY